MSPYLWIGLGGFLGANLRYLVQTGAAHLWGTAFPYGTMIANVTGSFVLTFFAALATERFLASQETRLFIATGVLGGYTTFSSFSYETWRLFELHGWWLAVLNLCGNLLLGGAGVVAALIVAHWIS